MNTFLFIIKRKINPSGLVSCLLPKADALFHVHEADVHDEQCVSGQGSGCGGQHFHHLHLSVHMSDYDKTAHRTLHDALPGVFVPVVDAAHAQNVVRQIPPRRHGDELQLRVVLRHPQRQARVRDGRRPDLVDADIREAHFKREREEGQAAEAVEVLADLFIPGLPSALLGAFYHAARFGQEDDSHKVRQVSLELVVEPLVVQHEHHVHLEGGGTVDQSLISRPFHPAASVDDAASHAGLPVYLTALRKHLGKT